MANSVICRLALLVCVLSILLLTGCGLFGDRDDPIDILREEVRLTVTDAERAEKMLATVDRIEQLLDESAESLSEAVRQERKLFRDYDSTPQDYEAFFARATSERQRIQEALLDAHIEFKANATAEEWQVLLPVHANAISMRVEALVTAALAEAG